MGTNSGTVQECYNSGDITVRGNHAGGVVGAPRSGATIEDCYYLDTAAASGSGSGSGSGITALTLAQIEDKEEGLLAKLQEEASEAWNGELSALGAWEYGKPALQPVLSWQKPVQNTPTYTVTIPETVTADGSFTISAQAEAFLADQQVQVAVAEGQTFEMVLEEDGGTASGEGGETLGYALTAGETQLKGGDQILSTGNTQPGAPVTASLTIVPETAARYAGVYLDEITFTVSVAVP